MSNSELFKGYLSQPTDRDCSFVSVSEEDVIKIINNLKPKSRCGCDEISVKLIKFAKNELCKPITYNVNQFLETGRPIFPDKLKIAKVIPLFKKGDPEQIDNYRPISILSAIYTTKIDGVVCPPNISETVAGRPMKLAHPQRIASTTIKLI